METKVEALKDNRKKLTVSVDATEVDNRIKKTYRDFAGKYNFPGFRKGKAPRPVIDSMLGPNAVTATVTEDIINSLYPRAMDEADLIAIGQPSFEQESDLVEAGKSFSFSATVEVRPEFSLSSYDAIEIKLPSVEATEEEIDSQVDELRNYYYTFEDAPASKKLAAGDFAEISLEAVDANGNHVESLETESRLYELSSGLFSPAFDEALIGLSKGKKATVEVDMSEPSLMGQGMDNPGKVTLTVEVKQVKKKVLPALDDEWAKETAGFEGGVAELRERVADSIKQQKEQMMPRLRENEALYALQERLEGEAPKAMCDVEEQSLLQNFFMQIQQQGVTFDAYLAQMGLTAEQFRDDLKKQARDVTEQDLALDAWARHAKIDVTDEEISAEFAKADAAHAASLEKEWRDAGRIATLRAGMRRTAALSAIMDNMKVSELAPGEKLNSVKDDADNLNAKTGSSAKKAKSTKATKETKKSSTGKAKTAAGASKATTQAAKASASANDSAAAKPTKTELGKLKVAELREQAAAMGIDADGMKKADLIEALLKAE